MCVYTNQMCFSTLRLIVVTFPAGLYTFPGSLCDSSCLQKWRTCTEKWLGQSKIAFLDWEPKNCTARSAFLRGVWISVAQKPAIPYFNLLLPTHPHPALRSATWHTGSAAEMTFKNCDIWNREFPLYRGAQSPGKFLFLGIPGCSCWIWSD